MRRSGFVARRCGWAAADRVSRGETMPEPLFILCPPRSYSSIVCGMLGQHPQCYGLPELNLFLADTIGEIWYGSTFFRSSGFHGICRTLAQLHSGEQTEEAVILAKEWITARPSWPVRRLFDHIQELVGDRILIDKSPSTLFRRDHLERLLRVYPNANILHLIRHPRGMGESLITLRKTDKSLKFFDQLVTDAQRLDPERMWRNSHEMAVALTDPLPLGQCMRVKGELMMSQLDVFLPQLCEWLGIRSDAEAIAAMMHPEDSPYARLGPANAPGGNDPNFLQDPKVDMARLARLKEPSLVGELSWRTGDGFRPKTIRLAKQLGYA